MASNSSTDNTQHIFTKLKASCVPLLGNSLLTPASIPIVSTHLHDIIAILQEAVTEKYHLKSSLVQYVFFPISTILQRNASATIPDLVLERALVVLSILCESWWWEMDTRVWEQIFMLSGAVIGGLEGNGKGKGRDDETRTAAVQCLWALLHERSPAEDPDQEKVGRAEDNFTRFRSHSQTNKFIPVLGQTVHSLLGVAESPHRPLQQSSLDVLQAVTKHYLADGFSPSVLPGVASAMCKVALGIGLSRGWANGNVVAAALAVFGNTITASIGDAICVREGAVKGVDDLESLTQLFTETTSQPETSTSKFNVPRTPMWLQGTASQLHIAMKSLQPLVTHPTPFAQIALATFSSSVLQTTALTLPQSQPLLLSYLLSLSVCDFPQVSSHAERCTQDVLTGSRRHGALQILLHISKDTMSSLPRHLSLRAEAKLVHATGIVSAICNLGSSGTPAAIAVRGGIESLLGPNGSIEKWGWSLLPMLEFTTVSHVLSASSATQSLLMSNNQSAILTSFPEITLRHVSTKSTRSLERMFHSLGRAAGESCSYSIEWFFNVGRNGRGIQHVAALWCAARLLEGATSVSLTDEAIPISVGTGSSKRLERLARNISRSIAEIWDEPFDLVDAQPQAMKSEELEVTSIQHVVGLLPVRGSVDQQASLPSAESKPSASQAVLHKMTLLQLLSVAAGVLEVRFVSTLLETLFPILHSLASEDPLLATTALATLQYIANATSYATPANMLLSNFDYGLDAVSRRLSRRWLDLDATSVLVILIRLVGRDVVQRAGDVVEECFDRLDEYHGYEVLVKGLMSVLAEVVEAIAADRDAQAPLQTGDAADKSHPRSMQGFLEWFTHRNDSNPSLDPDEDVGPVPQEAWGSPQQEEADATAPDPIETPPSTPTELLVQQIISRSLYFLTHDSRLIRARILTLLASAATVLPAALILPSIHHAWPFVLNRLADPEPFVVSAAATLIENLAIHFGDFMYGRIWDDVWPRFLYILRKLEMADSSNALSRRGPGAVGTESAYTHSHRLYRSLLRTMTAAIQGVQVKDDAVWDVIVAHRRFLHSEAHEELQSCARELYVRIGKKNEDAVWFALTATQDPLGGWTHLHEPQWNVTLNTELVLQNLRNT